MTSDSVCCQSIVDRVGAGKSFVNVLFSVRSINRRPAATGYEMVTGAPKTQDRTNAGPRLLVSHCLLCDCIFIYIMMTELHS